MALIHQNHCQHGWERFLPWHRVYLYEFEQVLQDVCPGITMPYWDWTMTHYCPEHPDKGWIIPPAFKAYLTKESITYLTDPEQADPALPEEVGATLLREMVEPGLRYTSQSTFFADVAKFTNAEYTSGGYRERFIDALLAANALWYPLRYPSEYHDMTTNKPLPVNRSIFHYHYPTAEDMEQILSLRTFRDFGGGSFYDDSFGFLDQNPHNTMHIWTGGQNPQPPAPSAALAIDGRHRNRGVQVAGRRFHTREDLYSQPVFGDMLSNLTASYDPVFWPIHVNIDRLWHEWQQRNPHSQPVELDAVLTPWSYTIADTLDMSRFGYEYVKSAYLVPVGLATPVGRFVSKPISIPDTVRSSFERAEVRLHRVPQLPRSCFIRVFLNLPDANASTSIEDSHYAGYLAIFGHASCIGGPGHCDLPPSRPRPYDQRPRHHNTPRNHRVNVTKTAKRLLDAGATSLQITLVVIGADYCEDNELLRLEGVSLDFLD
jgi:tyrosinase